MPTSRGSGITVDIITTPNENEWLVVLVTIVFCFSLGIVALVFSILEKFHVTAVSMVLCALFVVIVLALKGAFKRGRQ